MVALSATTDTTPAGPGSSASWWDSNPAKAAMAAQARRSAKSTARRREAAVQARTGPLEPAPAPKVRRRRPLSEKAQQTTAALKAKALGLPTGYGRVLAAGGQLHPALDSAPVDETAAPAWAGSSCSDPDRPGALLGDRAAWYHAKTVSRLLNVPTDLLGEKDEKRRAAIRAALRRHVRYAQREVLWKNSNLKRVRVCGRAAVGPTSQIVVKAAAGACHYAGLATCGSIWACPVCSAKIRAHRAEEITTGVAQWIKDGHAAYMVSLTMPHDLVDALSPLIDTVIKGFTSLLSGRTYAGSAKTRRQKKGQKLEGPLEWVDGEKQTYGIVGTIKAIEVTHGLSGWHPHAHVLVLTDKPLTKDQLKTIHKAWYKRWANFVVKQGYRMPKWIGADGKHVGMDWRPVRTAKEAAEYIAKVQEGKVDRHLGNELTRADLKEGRRTGRTPFEVLEDFRWSGDLAERAVWHEYEEATFKRNAITWSPGLKAMLLGIEDEDDPSDEEVAAEEVGGDHMAIFEVNDWRKVTRVPGLACAVLRAGETGGLAGIRTLLKAFGIAVYSPDDLPKPDPATSPAVSST